MRRKTRTFKWNAYASKFRAWEGAETTSSLLGAQEPPTRLLCILNACVGQSIGAQILPADASDVPLGCGKTVREIVGDAAPWADVECLADERGLSLVLACRSPAQAEQIARQCAACEACLHTGFLSKVPAPLQPPPLRPESLVPGLELFYEAIPSEMERELIAALESPQLVGEWDTLNDRRVLHYGFEVAYAAALGPSSFRRPVGLRAALPAWAQPALKRYVALCPGNPAPDQLTANHYLPGQGIAPHVDSLEAFGEPLVLFGLESHTVLEFRRLGGKCGFEGGANAKCNGSEDGKSDEGRKCDAETVQVFFPARALVVISGDARSRWTHAIRARRLDFIDGRVLSRQKRWSLTFRVMAPIASGGHQAAT